MRIKPINFNNQYTRLLSVITIGLFLTVCSLQIASGQSLQGGTRKQAAIRPQAVNLLKPVPGRLSSYGLKPNDHVNLWKGDKVIKLWRGDTSAKEITLTFDDGPHPQFTYRLLELLRQLDVKATFFVVGKKVDESPQVVADILQQGHEIGNHTYHHINLDNTTQAVVEEEIRLCNVAVKKACGKTPVVFRPPGGHHQQHIMAGAEKMGMPVILWTDDPADFAKPGADVILARILKEVASGSDILLHDGMEQTLEMLPELIIRLKHDGYRFVTLSEMLRHTESEHTVLKVKKFPL